jgi:hypothetical protein
MTWEESWCTCRLCGKRDRDSEMLRYSTRSYAHFECFAARKTLADVDALPHAPRQQFWQWWHNKKKSAGDDAEPAR